MASPRVRRAIPLPAPATYTSLRQVLAVKILATLLLWAGPALLLPPPWFAPLGIPEPAAHLVFVRLLGAAYLALVVGYALAWRAPARHPGAVLAGVVSNGLAALVIVRVGIQGGLASWHGLGAFYIWGSAALTAALCAALLVTGRPLLQRLVERPPAASAKIA